ncbi:hypothetical protein P43SY_000101 [Pythium insidiosum]|uniref:Cilia- and flagella-associated protein 36 n=1 Tax=Pythium insidiosum TaxID=114742 RepID=A0AAD5LTD6_PYTIN|nr:hypothetical protein P43SY_000101 [Pythium insidiosum]
MPREHKAEEKGDDGADFSARDVKLQAAAGAKGRDADVDADDDDDGEWLVRRVIQYFFDDDAFAGTFERFAEDNCHVFDLDSDEMKLEYTTIYNRFQSLFESKIEDYIVAQGATVSQFYESSLRPPTLTCS